MSSVTNKSVVHFDLIHSDVLGLVAESNFGIKILFKSLLVSITSFNKMRLQSERITILLRFPEFYSQTPVEHILSFFPSSPLLLNLSCRVFECVIFHSHSPNCGKLDLRTIKFIFIGYPPTKK
ncbi:hypothetical protein CR513_47285, partial [Mucuna pruriens]